MITCKKKPSRPPPPPPIDLSDNGQHVHYGPPPAIAPRSKSAFAALSNDKDDESPANLYIPISECHTGLPQQRYHQKSRSLGVGGGIQYLDLNLDSSSSSSSPVPKKSHSNDLNICHHHHHSTGGVCLGDRQQQQVIGSSMTMGKQHYPSTSSAHKGNILSSLSLSKKQQQKLSSPFARGSSSSMSMLQSIGQSIASVTSSPHQLLRRSSPNHSASESLESPPLALRFSPQAPIDGHDQSSTVYRTVDFERTKALNKTKVEQMES